jgi:diguanylate cyclase (GGDEF)-like protein
MMADARPIREAVLSNSTKRRIVIYFAIFTLLSGCVSISVLRGNMPLASGLFTLAYLANAAVTTFLCLRRSLRSPHLKAHWILMTAAFGSNIVIAIVALLVSSGPYVNVTTFFIFCTYIPLFLLISLPAGRRYFHYFIWLDLVQAIMVMYVGYTIIFRDRPFTHDVPSAISGTALFHLFLTGDLIILAGGLLHIFTAVNKDEMRFYRLVFLLNLLGTAAVYIHNVLLLRNPKETLTGIPVLLAGFFNILLVLYSPAETIGELPGQSKGLLADLINIASPALPSALLLTLGIIVESQYQSLGRAAVITAFVLFVTRATFYHRSFEALHRDLEEARASLEHLSYTDGLTGVANRRALEKALLAEWNRSIRSGSPLSFLLIDVDFFKQVNDRRGHQAGDDYLVAISGALCIPLRRSIDVIGRYGGDEFAVVLPSTDSTGAETVAEKMCREVQQLRVENSATATGFATISIGVVTCLTFTDPSALLEAADAALYDAKHAGRNCWRSNQLKPGESGPLL